MRHHRVEDKIPCMWKCVCASISLRLFMSTIRPNCLRKSASRIGFLTSAIMIIQGSDHLRPRMSVRERFPLVHVAVLLVG